MCARGRVLVLNPCSPYRCVANPVVTASGATSVCVRAVCVACDCELTSAWPMWAHGSMGAWAASVAAMLGPSCDTNATRLPFTGAPLHVVMYEDLVEDPVGTLAPLLAFLGTSDAPPNAGLISQTFFLARARSTHAWRPHLRTPRASMRLLRYPCGRHHAHCGTHTAPSASTVAGVPAERAQCVAPTLASGAAARARRGRQQGSGHDHPGYPNCPLSGVELQAVVAKAGPCLATLGYGVCMYDARAWCSSVVA